MPIPWSPKDTFETAAIGGAVGQDLGAGLGLSQSPPSATGIGTRQQSFDNLFPYGKPATNRRKMMRWMVPEQPIVEMYVNPEEVKATYAKQVSETRTKGGWLLQYWGEEITGLTLSGTTGSSGIEGINVLYDVYRNEQFMFDPYALLLAAERDREEQSRWDDFLGLELFTGSLTNLFNPNQKGPAITASPKPTLASLAFTVELFWSGETYRGYFKDFSITESSQNIGLFTYNITFRVLQRRGFRSNFFGWHRAATRGPSNSNPDVGPPHSFSGFVPGQAQPRRNRFDQPNLKSRFKDPKNQSGAITRQDEDTIIDGFVL